MTHPGRQHSSANHPTCGAGPQSDPSRQDDGSPTPTATSTDPSPQQPPASPISLEASPEAVRAAVSVSSATERLQDAQARAALRSLVVASREQTLITELSGAITGHHGNAAVLVGYVLVGMLCTVWGFVAGLFF